MHATLSNAWHGATGKGRLITRCNLYKGNFPIVDSLVWSCGVRDSEVPVYIKK